MSERTLTTDDLPGCATQVYSGWVWMIDSTELRWSKSTTREACEAVVLDVARRQGLDALTND
jgi:hypothetical protein